MIGYDVCGRGPAVVLLHGVGLDRSMWDRCAALFARRLKLVAVDLRGHGASPRAAAGTSLDDLAEDVVGVLDELALRNVHVVGFSLGALVAQRLAISHPDRAVSLTLVSSVAGRGEPERAAVLARLRSARDDWPATAEAAIDRWFSSDRRAQEPELVSHVRTVLLRNDLESYLTCYEIFATADADVWPDLHTIACPTLVMTGEDDPGSTPEMTRRLATTIPRAESIILPGTRHLLPIERPRELCDAVLNHIKRTEYVSR